MVEPGQAEPPSDSAGAKGQDGELRSLAAPGNVTVSPAAKPDAGTTQSQGAMPSRVLSLLSCLLDHVFSCQTGHAFPCQEVAWHDPCLPGLLHTQRHAAS